MPPCPTLSVNPAPTLVSSFSVPPNPIKESTSIVPYIVIDAIVPVIAEDAVSYILTKADSPIAAPLLNLSSDAAASSAAAEILPGLLPPLVTVGGPAGAPGAGLFLANSLPKPSVTLCKRSPSLISSLWRFSASLESFFACSSNAFRPSLFSFVKVVNIASIDVAVLSKLHSGTIACEPSGKSILNDAIKFPL